VAARIDERLRDLGLDLPDRLDFDLDVDAVANEHAPGFEGLVVGQSEIASVNRCLRSESRALVSPRILCLLESELFGHACGAFTGANQDRPGLFEAAQGGTLLLDEIGEVPPSMQVKLLRVLQEREVRRVGENRNRPVNARVLAATNRDLQAEIHAARFRQDLFYRLRVVEIRVPPLRERRDDIVPLARTFLSSAVTRTGRQISTFTPAAIHRLLRYRWPGNVRELENVIERAVVLADGDRIDAVDLPEEVALATPGAHDANEVRTMAEVERDYIKSVLQVVGDNRAKAAEALVSAQQRCTGS
jgi:DNA-binding NtrC family response regulator